MRKNTFEVRLSHMDELGDKTIAMSQHEDLYYALADAVLRMRPDIPGLTMDMMAAAVSELATHSTLPYHQEGDPSTEAEVEALAQAIIKFVDAGDALREIYARFLSTNMQRVADVVLPKAPDPELN